MSLGAKVHKSGFEAGFYASDFTFVYIRFFLDPGSVFDVKVVESLSVDKSNAEFLFLRSVD